MPSGVTKATLSAWRRAGGACARSSARLLSARRHEAVAGGDAAFTRLGLVGAFCWSGREARVNVLIAEDETIIRLDLRGLLERHGMTVCAEAGDGERAVELARTERPDLAVL